MANAAIPWKVSLHGGHCGDYCGHAVGSLREILEAAVAQGYHTYGVTEHAPRLGETYLHGEEREAGWDVARLEADFDAYAKALRELAEEFDGRLTVLRGFEIEVVPHDSYAHVMREYRQRYDLEYIVGSVHFMNGRCIDSTQELFDEVVGMEGGVEPLAVHYYERVAEMVEALKPEVIGHLDLVRKMAPSDESVATPAIQKAAGSALEVIRDHGSILDLNTGAYDKGLDSPYPAPWLLKKAHQLGIGFCFGDDSHGPFQVGRNINRARQYLLDNGVSTITVLTREEEGLAKRIVPLDS